MKYTITLFLLLLAISAAELQAQFPVTISINSKGSFSPSPVTKTNAVYRITVEGTYSMWPQFNDCHGVDGAYVYEVPQEEIDNFRWPPPDIFGIPFVELPHWVGDPKTYSFPPKEMGLDPLFEMSFVKNTGLRIDGAPLPNTGIDTKNHKYTIELAGTGKPFVFQILDSNYNISQLKMLPRYDDNCGFLLATIEEINSDTAYKLEICHGEFAEEGDKTYLYLNLKLYKGSDPAGSRNLIDETDSLILKIGDKYIYKTTYKCTGERKPIDAMFLLDNSGSMLAGPGKTDTIQRIDAALNYIKTLVNSNTLIPSDSIAFMAFRETPQVLSGWNSLGYIQTNLPAILFNIRAGWKTGLAAALDDAISTFPNTARKKALFVLSDYYETSVENPDFSTAGQFDGRAFLLNYGMGGSKTDTSGTKNLKNLYSIFQNGIIYNYPEFSAIAADIADFAGKGNNTDCCEYKIPFDPCMFNKDTTVALEIIFTSGNSRYEFERDIFLNCKSDTTEPGLIKYARSIAVNRNNGLLTIESSDEGSEILVKILDTNGREVMQVKFNGSYSLDINNLPCGLYFMQTIANGITRVQKFIIY